jgi:hypothetical protein
MLARTIADVDAESEASYLPTMGPSFEALVAVLYLLSAVLAVVQAHILDGCLPSSLSKNARKRLLALPQVGSLCVLAPMR